MKVKTNSRKLKWQGKQKNTAPATTPLQNHLIEFAQLMFKEDHKTVKFTSTGTVGFKHLIKARLLTGKEGPKLAYVWQLYNH